MKPHISAVISAYNEEQNLGRCLSSVSWADEIVVIDNSSSDKTVEIARKFTKNVYTRENHLMLNINKNFGFEKAQGPWILNLDADEVVTPELGKEMALRVSDPSNQQGYWIERKNIIFGTWIQHGLWWPDKQLRLFKKNKGKFPCQNIHEYIHVDGPVGELTEPMLHYNYTTISEYLQTIDRCSKSEALLLKDSAYKIHWTDAVRFPVSDFIKIFFAQKAYKDGLHGLVLSIFQAFYSFVTFARLWEDAHFVEEHPTLEEVAKEASCRWKEMQFWSFSALIEKYHTHPLKQLFFRLKRKLYFLL